jgi:hypothetical protein
LREYLPQSGYAYDVKNALLTECQKPHISIEVLVQAAGLAQAPVR